MFPAQAVQSMDVLRGLWHNMGSHCGGIELIFPGIIRGV